MNTMSLLLKIEVWSHNLGFASLLMTMILFWIEFNFKESFEIKSSFPPQRPELESKTSRDNGTAENFSLADWGVCFSNILLSLILGLRWVNSGHFPLSNLYESLIFLSWTITLIHVGILLSTRPFGLFTPSVGGKLPLSWVGIITSPVALILNTFASFSLPEEMQNGGPLVPALQSNWLMMHVTLMILSYAALLLGSLVAIIFLVITSSLPPVPSSHEVIPLRSLEVFDSSSGLPVPAGREPLVEGEAHPDEKSSEKLKFINATDNLSYRLIGLGFPLLTIGIISGAVWANEAWGSYWSWDPKETWALITWLLFAIYLHTRLNKGWKGKKPAVIATIGFLLIWICYLGVNLLGKGLHSYGFFQ